MKKLAGGCITVLIIAPTLALTAFAAIQPALFAAMLWRMFWTFVALCTVVIVILVAILHNRRERRDRTYMDGALPLMRRRRRIWRADLPFVFALYAFMVGDEFFIDPNRMGAAAWSFSAFGQVSEVQPAHGWEMQHQYNLATESTNKVRAAFPGQESNNHMFGRDAAIPRFPSARVLAPKIDKAQPLGLPQLDDEPQPERQQYAAIGDALAANRGPSLYLGQNDEDAALWNPRTDPHLGVWGKSGSGKSTRLGLTVALAQIVQGYRVIVIDPDLETGTSVWRSLSPWAQVITPGEPGCSLWAQIMEWYEARRANLEQRGVTENYQLDRPLTPLAIHFEEFVRWRDRCKARGGDDHKYYGYVVDCMSEIAQRGRKPGCHLTIYGQLPGELPEAIAGNLVGATLKQNANQGNKVGHWGAHQLAPGQFAYEGGVYNSFQPVADVPRLLSGRTPKDYIVSPDAVRGCVRETVRGEREGVRTPVDTPLDERTNATNANDGPKWEEFTRKWLQSNQPSPSALARAMAAVEGNVKPYERYKSIAAQMIKASGPTPPLTWHFATGDD